MELAKFGFKSWISKFIARRLEKLNHRPDKESACSARDPGSIPRKIPWRRKWQPTLIFLPGKSHGQRNLADCSPWGQKEADTPEHTPKLILKYFIFG